MASKHPGFQAVQASIADKTNPRTGKPYGKEKAGAILASAARKSSAAAKRKNPRLKKVKGSPVMMVSSEMAPHMKAMSKKMGKRNHLMQSVYRKEA